MEVAARVDEELAIGADQQVGLHHLGDGRPHRLMSRLRLVVSGVPAARSWSTVDTVVPVPELRCLANVIVVVILWVFSLSAEDRLPVVTVEFMMLSTMVERSVATLITWLVACFRIAIVTAVPSGSRVGLSTSMGLTLRLPPAHTLVGLEFCGWVSRTLWPWNVRLPPVTTLRACTPALSELVPALRSTLFWLERKRNVNTPTTSRMAVERMPMLTISSMRLKPAAWRFVPGRVPAA